ncbi:hypothetical protein PVAP13_6NG269800 [Panicum virgatum]|uniref:Uncharacterized protein n=2 Tax=Panicum virgatum TaxID=38727 RepID=A0A8T0R4D8_PANVG|nr:hypothetical protein PVAP13_6NG269800 [Panicum virgatum]
MFDSCFTRFKLDYDGTKSLGIGDAASRDVSVGGHRWRIDCYPRGYRAEDNGEYVSLCLELTGDSTGGGGGVEAFVTKPDGAPSSSRTQRTRQVYSSSPPAAAEGVRSLAFRQFVKWKDIESLYLADGWATITCRVIVTGRGRDNDPLVAPPPDIGTHLGLLLDCADGSDVSFVVDGERFPAHRAVLAARSPVFKAQLLGPTSKARASSVTVPDMAPATFRAMLRFVYTDACPAVGELGASPSEVYPRLLAAADRYALDRLKLVCAGKLWGNVSADTVAATLACAEACSCPELKTKCVGFLVDEKNFRDAVLTDGFVQLVQKFPSMIAELKEAAGKQ